jgi:hypothetical protein
VELNLLVVVSVLVLSPPRANDPPTSRASHPTPSHFDHELAARGATSE